jgi:hypothetical protein
VEGRVKVVVGSAFRNSEGRVDRYFEQVAAFARYGKEHAFDVRVAAIEGDSTDGTRARLQQPRDLDVDVVIHEHGGPVYGSTEDPARMAQLTGVGNAIFNSVRESDDVLVYVESDLMWDAATIHSLMLSVICGACDVVAPLVFAGPHFYDIYAFRKNGVRFSPFYPYHADLNGEQLVDVDSAGSCLVMSAQVAREVRIPVGGVLVEWCNSARAAGYRVCARLDLGIQHGI